MKTYILDTETNASFGSENDALEYFRSLKEDEPHADVRAPIRNPNDGRYVVKLWKSETVQATRL